ncbi:hypothetical protein [Moorena producens]|uniref:hypothetical protein n=1 Tax=Moorena producens TaxID=1155739 RepID=UPI003C751EC5
MTPCPCSLFPIPYSLFPVPCSLFPVPKFPTTATKSYNCLGERQMQYVIHRLKSRVSKLPELFHDQ